MEPVHCYYYLHENGTVIWKPAAVTVNDKSYFSSPFVKKLWTIRTFEDLGSFMGDLRNMGLKPPRGGVYW